MKFGLTWTEAEDETLRAIYGKVPNGYKRACEALPGRSPAAVFHRANRLGLTARRRWTKSDDAQLRDLWESGLGVSWIAKRLDRTPLSTFWRAQTIGLPLGCPDGWEYLSHAAKRTGYGTGQLRAILGWAEVEIKRGLSRPFRRQAARRSSIVVPEDVDDAITRWHDTEPAEAIARRIGLSGETLRRWARAAGIDKREPGSKKHLRLTAAEVDALTARAA